MDFFSENRIEQKVFFKILSFGLKVIGESDFLSRDDPFHDCRIYKFSTAVLTDFQRHALVIILAKRNMTPRAIILYGTFGLFPFSPFQCV